MVEKLNANVMHGKVRKMRSDSSQGVMILCLWSGGSLSFLLASVPGQPTEEEATNLKDLEKCNCKLHAL